MTLVPPVSIVPSVVLALVITAPLIPGIGSATTKEAAIERTGLLPRALDLKQHLADGEELENGEQRKKGDIHTTTT